MVEYLKNHNGDVTYDEEIVNHVNTSSAAGMSGGLERKVMTATCIL